jgi:hypothetical protein
MCHEVTLMFRRCAHGPHGYKWVEYCAASQRGKQPCSAAMFAPPTVVEKACCCTREECIRAIGNLEAEFKTANSAYEAFLRAGTQDTPGGWAAWALADRYARMAKQAAIDHEECLTTRLNLPCDPTQITFPPHIATSPVTPLPQ